MITFNKLFLITLLASLAPNAYGGTLSDLILNIPYALWSFYCPRKQTTQQKRPPAHSWVYGPVAQKGSPSFSRKFSECLQGAISIYMNRGSSFPTLNNPRQKDQAALEQNPWFMQRLGLFKETTGKEDRQLIGEELLNYLRQPNVQCVGSLP